MYEAVLVRYFDGVLHPLTEMAVSDGWQGEVLIEHHPERRLKNQLAQTHMLLQFIGAIDDDGLMCERHDDVLLGAHDDESEE